MNRLLEWNGEDLPEGLRELPPGRYVVEAVDEVPALTADEEAGLEEALTSLRQGRGVSAGDVRRRAEAAIRR